MKKQKIAAALLSLGLLSTLFSCTNVQNIPDPPSGTSKDESFVESLPEEEEKKLSAAEWVAKLPEKDFVKKDFTIATIYPGFASPNEDREDIIDATVKQRNQLLYDKYGLNVREIALKPGELSAKIREGKLAGKPFADIAHTSARDIASAAASGELLALNMVPYLDLRAEYTEKPLTTDGEIGSTVFGLYGSLTLADHSAWAVFYNRKFLKDLGYVNLENMVKNGEWTLDKFLEISEKAAKDTMDKLSPDISRDKFGFATYYGSADQIKAFWQTSGMRTFGDENKSGIVEKPEIMYDFDKSQQITDKIGKVIKNKSDFPGSGKDALVAFNENRLAFMMCRLDFAQNLKEGKSDWGLLPMPKFDSETPEITPTDDYITGFCLPVNEKDTDEIGFFLNAFAAASHGQMRNAFEYDYVNRYLFDNSQALMLRHILDNMRADPALIYSSAFPQIDAIASDIIVKASKDGANLKATVEKHRKNFDNFVENHLR